MNGCVRARRRSATVILTLILALLAGAVPGVAGAATGACTSSGNFEVCFNDPTGSATEQNRIVDRLRALIRSAGQGDSIRVAMYSWTLDGIAEELVDATTRLVDIRVVMDDSDAGKSPYNKLVGAGIPVTVCTLSCTSGDANSIQHNKLFLFDIGGTRSVVVTSSNMTGTQKSERYNDLLRISNDSELYQFFIQYWVLLRNKSWGGWGNGDRVRTGSLPTKGYVFERDDFDVVAAILNNVTACRDGDAKIWVAMAKFTDNRAAVQRRLEELENMGCNVKVIIQRSADEPFVQRGLSWDDNDPMTFLTKSKVRQMPGAAVDIHHKLLIIDAQYNGTYQEVVFTGSHNFTGPALHRHDENWVRVRNSFVFSQYTGHFNTLYARSTD